MNITVYLGANAGNDPALAQATAELGRWIGESGNTLVYGGSESGLMGVLAKSALAAGGKAIGVEPQFFIDEGYEFDGLTELIVTRDMSERKAKMIELGEAFIALPGGTGTLEEIAEVDERVVLGIEGFRNKTLQVTPGGGGKYGEISFNGELPEIKDEKEQSTSLDDFF